MQVAIVSFGKNRALYGGKRPNRLGGALPVDKQPVGTHFYKRSANVCAESGLRFKTLEGAWQCKWEPMRTRSKMLQLNMNS